MPTTHAIYLEVGNRRVFAGAVEWPGWCRSGRDEGEAMEALLAHGARYREAIGRWVRGFTVPKSAEALDILERLAGNATTDFGAPGIAPSADDRPLDRAETARLVKVLEATWAAFDAATEASEGADLRKGPRGGGREVGAMVAHVLEADRAYLSRLGVATHIRDMPGVRRQIVEVVKARARGEPPPRLPRSGKLWTPRYGVRRSAWHALDHAWEIRDRVIR